MSLSATSRRPSDIAALLAAMVLAVPAFAGPPFRTDDPEPVEFQHFEMMLLSTGSKTAGGWNIALPAYEVNYGALPNLQVHAIVPQDYTAPAAGRAGFAPGDIELGIKYRFITPNEDD